MSDPLPLNPRDSEIELTERVAKRLFRWSKWYIGVMTTVGVIFLAVFGLFGWTGFRDFKESIDDFNRNVKPLVQQAKQDAQEASLGAGAAKKQTKETTEEARKTSEEAANQLKSVKNVTGTIAQLEKDVANLNVRMSELQKKVTANPSQTPVSVPPPKCEEVEVHVVAPSPSDFNFPEQRVGTTSESLNLGASCSKPRGGEAEAKVLFTLQGPFYFFDGGQTLMRPVMGASPIHIGVLFRPIAAGPASGTLQISSPDRATIKPRGFDSPAKLTGIGKN